MLGGRGVEAREEGGDEVGLGAGGGDGADFFVVEEGDDGDVAGGGGWGGGEGFDSAEARGENEKMRSGSRIGQLGTHEETRLSIRGLKMNSLLSPPRTAG